MKDWTHRFTVALGVALTSGVTLFSPALEAGNSLEANSLPQSDWTQNRIDGLGQGSLSGGQTMTTGADQAYLYQGRSVRIAVLENDLASSRGSAPTVTAIVRDSVHGTTTITANSEIHYTPIDPNFVGVDSFRYEATDSQGHKGEAEVTLTVRQSEEETRGRPIFLSGSLRADNNELLRGAFWNTDLNGGLLPTTQQVTDMRNQGFNTLHVYAEAFGCGYEAGEHLNAIMTLNDRVKNAGLYLIITIGNGDGNGPPPNLCTSTRINGEAFDIPFAKSFWQQYAQAFADEPQVIFELYNEAYHEFAGGGTLKAQPSPDRTIDLEVEAYLTVREHAPASPVLLFSYGTFNSLAGVLEDIGDFEQGVISSGVTPYNYGIAFHGYTFPKGSSVALGIIEDTIQALQNDNYGLVMTENRAIQDEELCTVPGFPPATPCIDPIMIHLFERQEVSWTSFIRLNQFANGGFEAKFRRLIDYGFDGNAIVWPADYGTWPATYAPPGVFPPQTPGSPPTAVTKTAFFQSQLNGKWVSASQGSPGTGPLVADRPAPGGWEAFEVHHQTVPQFCLVSRIIVNAFPERDPIVTAGWTSTVDPLMANQRNCNRRALFDWLLLPDNSVVLRAPHYAFRDATLKPSWRFVSVESGPAHPRLLDNATLVGPAEKFTVLIED
ncbi:MAG: cellulase family glycosylhydrolase [Deltaproteobacteria bacterium]|nr:cellulase family glycosylhydrolase [Deltaproteobacteria bacterium]